jgi:hypothetical protein
MDGFLVSASRQAGRTAWVAVRSEAGAPCVLKVPDWRGALECVGSTAPEIVELTPGEDRLGLRAGQEVVLRPQGSAAEPVLRPCPHPPSERNLYGVKRGQQLKTLQNWPEVPIPATGTNAAPAG